jgi:hypothetical protein
MVVSLLTSRIYSDRTRPEESFRVTSTDPATAWRRRSMALTAGLLTLFAVAAIVAAIALRLPLDLGTGAGAGVGDPLRASARALDGRGGARLLPRRGGGGAAARMTGGLRP